MRAPVSELNRLGVPDSDLVFCDHASIPQIPRTQDETRRVRDALGRLHLLHTFRLARVLIIPEVSEHAPNPMQYAARGWCPLVGNQYTFLTSASSLIRRPRGSSGVHPQARSRHPFAVQEGVGTNPQRLWRLLTSVVVLHVLFVLPFDLRFWLRRVGFTAGDVRCHDAS